MCCVLTVLIQHIFDDAQQDEALQKISHTAFTLISFSTPEDAIM